jgi:hypothetical protein
VNNYRSIGGALDRSPLRKTFKSDDCAPQRLCARCSMFKVTAYRFSVFRRAFGREPLPNEPLFFIVEGSRPVPAPPSELRDQLSRAAKQTHVRLAEILEFLGMDAPKPPAKLRIVKR